MEIGTNECVGGGIMYGITYTRKPGQEYCTESLTIWYNLKYKNNMAQHFFIFTVQEDTV